MSSDKLTKFLNPFDDIHTGGQPDADDIAEAATFGIKTVFNIRTPGESGQEGIERCVKECGMIYRCFPIAGKEGITFENAKEFCAIAHSSEKPLLIHCGSGNRIGALYALDANANGKTKEESLAIGIASGLTGLRDHVLSLLK